MRAVPAVPAAGPRVSCAVRAVRAVPAAGRTRRRYVPAMRAARAGAAVVRVFGAPIPGQRILPSTGIRIQRRVLLSAATSCMARLVLLSIKIFASKVLSPQTTAPRLVLQDPLVFRGEMLEMCTPRAARACTPCDIIERDAGIDLYKSRYVVCTIPGYEHSSRDISVGFSPWAEWQIGAK